jgi:hypothetical protein
MSSSFTAQDHCNANDVGLLNQALDFANSEGLDNFTSIQGDLWGDAIGRCRHASGELGRAANRLWVDAGSCSFPTCREASLTLGLGRLLRLCSLQGLRHLRGHRIPAFDPFAPLPDRPGLPPIQEVGFESFMWRDLMLCTQMVHDRLPMW